MANAEITVRRTDKTVPIWDEQKQEHINSFLYEVINVKGDLYVERNGKRKFVKRGDKISQQELAGFIGVGVYYK